MRGIAFQAVKFKRNEIDKDEYLLMLQSLIGDEAFQEAEKLAEKSKGASND
jgi:hypothetical protein